MMKNISLLYKFSILCGVSLFFFGTVLGWIMTRSQEKSSIARSNHVTSTSITHEIRRVFHSSELTEKYIESFPEIIKEKIQILALSQDIEKIKIWASDGTVLWSNDKKMIGQRFEKSDELKQALDGRVVSAIYSIKDKYKIHEDSSGKMLELYVPMQVFDTPGQYMVLEVYQNVDFLYADIVKQKKNIWISLGIGFLCLYGILFSIVWQATRQIDRQNMVILRSEEKYRNLVHSAQDAIISVDSKGRVLFFNKAAEKIFGYVAAQMIGNSVSQLIPEEYQQDVVDWLQQTVLLPQKSDQGRVFEFEGKNSKGHIFPVELSYACLKAGDEVVFTGIIRDISKRKATQQQVIAMERQASVSVIAGSIGHELNNLLTVLVGYVELLANKPEDTVTVNKCVQIFRPQLNSLELHAHNLLALSQPQDPEMKAFHINEFLDEIAGLLTTSGLLKGFMVKRDYKDQLPQVLGDVILIEQVIRNLMINGVHAMGSQGVMLLATGLSSKYGFVEFSISDTGHGIPEDKLDQIFVPFYTTKKQGEGTGLGMHIVKQIIDQHKGYIRLASKEKVGTTITVGLPMVGSNMNLS